MSFLHREAIDWLADVFGDMVYRTDLSEPKVRAAIERHFEGGWDEFVRGCA